MDITDYEKKYMKFVSNQLNLPVFLASRNRFKTNITPLRKYIERKRLRYTNRCDEENARKNATFKKYRHIFGLEIKPPPESCPTNEILKQTRDMTRTNRWILPPNLYKAEKKLFENRKGDAGSYWQKIPTSQSLKKSERQPQWKFYDLHNNDKKRCNQYKSVFATNARIHRSTARSMVCDLSSCFHDPNDPAPANYFPQNHTIVHNVSPPIISKPLNPHRFLRRSCVPEKKTYLSIKSRFEPEPGRYDVRYPNFCPCSWKLLIVPNLDLLIDREKRLKFRRQPYTKISARRYCAPDWRHVAGRGHKHLFKLPRSELVKFIVKKKEEARRSKDPAKDVREALKAPLKLYADARYIGMINDPNRPKISFRKEFIQRNPKIFFNCLRKYGRRVKASLMSKKIAFSSGKERWHMTERPAILTVKQLTKLKENLPLERQLRDQPIMQKPLEEIKPRLSAIPKHMQKDYELCLRKRLFKFLPLPGTKVLIRENELQYRNEVKFYDKTLNPSLFLKDDANVRISV